MNTAKQPSNAQVAQAKKILSTASYGTLKRIAEGKPVRESTLIALGNAVTQADDYKPTPGRALLAPVNKKPNLSWPLAAVRQARDAQMAGDFTKSAPLAEAMKVDDAIFTAYYARCAPLASLAIALEPARAGKAVADKFEAGVTYRQEVLTEIGATMSMHGVAFGYNDQEIAEDGTTVRFVHRQWPIEFVKWDEKQRSYVTKVEGAPDELITHGDGHWTIYCKTPTLPHRQEACLIPCSLIFVAHRDVLQSWAASADSHGQAKIIGSLGEGMPMQDGDENTLSAEAEALLTTLNDLVSGEAGAGLIPEGADAKFISNGSSAWQVFHELGLNREKAAARVFLGTDGILGAQGGAPGVDISQLFGVALTKIQGDCAAIENCFYEGVIVPWVAINIGDSGKAPRIRYDIPDADADQKRQQHSDASVAMFDEIKRHKENGFELTQDVVDAIAAKYHVEPPTLAQQGDAVPSIVLAPTDVAKVTLVKEARAANGLPLLGDFRDDMTIDELTAYNETKKEQAKAAAVGAANNANTQSVPSDRPTPGPAEVPDPTSTDGETQDPVEPSAPEA